MEAELRKLEYNLGGVADMQRIPDAVVIIDLKTEEIALREAERLRDPDHRPGRLECDPGPVEYVIPGNDDAIRSCELIIGALGFDRERARARRRAEETRGRGAQGGGRAQQAEEKAKQEAEEKAKAEAEAKARPRPAASSRRAGRQAGRGRARGRRGDPPAAAEGEQPHNAQGSAGGQPRPAIEVPQPPPSDEPRRARAGPDQSGGES